MRFNSHSALEGQHAFLSPSTYHWIRYSEEKLEQRFRTSRAAQLGTDLHDLARQSIRLGVRMAKTRKTLNMYVNDAIAFGMTVEQPLYYSDNCFGTADAIGFSFPRLRIHDLKTGITRTSVHQLEVYAALFCLEYGFDPHDLEIELRIYQNDDVQIFEAIPDWISSIMETIVKFDALLESLKQEGA